MFPEGSRSTRVKELVQGKRAVFSTAPVEVQILTWRVGLLAQHPQVAQAAAKLVHSPGQRRLQLSIGIKLGVFVDAIGGEPERVITLAAERRSTDPQFRHRVPPLCLHISTVPQVWAISCTTELSDVDLHYFGVAEKRDAKGQQQPRFLQHPSHGRSPNQSKMIQYILITRGRRV